MALEVEAKLRIPDERTLIRIKDDTEIAALRLEEFRDVKMQAVYYDNPRHTLNERKWTLRLRKENERPVAVFKQMGRQEDSLFTREELSCEANTLESAVEKLIAIGAPAELMELGPFVERCRIQFTRTLTTLRLADGSVCELALDRGIIYAEEKQEALLEMELELLCGEPDEMVTLSKRLFERYGLQKELNSKYSRALRLLRSRN